MAGDNHMNPVVWSLRKLSDGLYVLGDAPRWLAGRLNLAANRIVYRQQRRLTSGHQ